jgi:transketolase
LGSAVCQITSGYKPIRVDNIAIPDEPAIAGTTSEVFAHYGITKERVIDLFKNAI